MLSSRGGVFERKSECLGSVLFYLQRFDVFARTSGSPAGIQDAYLSSLLVRLQFFNKVPGTPGTAATLYIGDLIAMSKTRLYPFTVRVFAVIEVKWSVFAPDEAIAEGLIESHDAWWEGPAFVVDEVNNVRGTELIHLYRTVRDHVEEGARGTYTATEKCAVELRFVIRADKQASIQHRLDEWRQKPGCFTLDVGEDEEPEERVGEIVVVHYLAIEDITVNLRSGGKA